MWILLLSALACPRTVTPSEPTPLERSPTHPVGQLLTAEVPEMRAGVVRIERIAREPGQRTKIAVSTTDPNVDPIEACVGVEGQRIRAVVEAMGGETIDLFLWDANPHTLATFALGPATVTKIYVDDEAKIMQLVVSDTDLDKALGEGGVNLRLAAQIVGWQLDLYPASRMAELETAHLCDTDGGQAGVDTVDCGPL